MAERIMDDGRLSAACLRAFVAESNRIEGITREPVEREIDDLRAFLALGMVGIGDVESYVQSVSGAELRDKPGMNVRVGDHIPWPGGQHIYSELVSLLDLINKALLTPYEAHTRYELLHPFMDGNGRSGRAIWAWHMRLIGQDPFALPFLHRFYYQTLDAARNTASQEANNPQPLPNPKTADAL